MESINIALPDSLRSFVLKRVSEAGYSSASEYVGELIRADQQRRHDERIEAMLFEGIASGEPIEVGADYWERKRRRNAKESGG